ncbi:MAG: hypothetical protein JJU05_06615 [Verrucomicrobia bacterium]|nr:hypothetical protein [Verrucomicrobiota bacterium]MCH8527080.1 hypothetical protein [Kiritimatiellia bacterium]
MAKHIALKPDWLKADQVEEILSVSDCTSVDFADWINYWKHNGFWFFDTSDLIVKIAEENKLDLSSVRWFYYEAYEQEFDDDLGKWRAFTPEESFGTTVVPPTEKHLKGFDIVTYSCSANAECSLLSCNHLAEKYKVNRHCLFNTFEEAIKFFEEKAYLGCEPGPLRIFAVYEVPKPMRTTSEPSVSPNPPPSGPVD